MTTDAVKVTNTIVEPLSLGTALLGILKRLLSPAGLSATEQKWFEAARRCAQSVGQPLLDAATMADFEELLDEAIEKPDFHQLNAELLHENPPDNVGSERASTRETAWPRELFGGAVDKLTEADHLMSEITVLRRRFLAFVPRNTVLTIAETIARHPLAFLEDPELPTEAKRAILDIMHGAACLFALLHALIENRRPEPWLSMALAEKMHEGCYQYLRLLAASPALRVSEELVPLSERFDVAKLDADSQSRNAWIRAFVGGASPDEDTAFPLAKLDVH